LTAGAAAPRNLVHARPPPPAGETSGGIIRLVVLRVLQRDKPPGTTLRSYNRGVVVGRQRRRNRRVCWRPIESSRERGSARPARLARYDAKVFYNVHKRTSSLGAAVNIEAKRIARDTSPCHGRRCLARILYALRVACTHARVALRSLWRWRLRSFLRKIESCLRGGSREVARRAWESPAAR